MNQNGYLSTHKETVLCIYQNSYSAWNAEVLKDINEIRRENAMAVLRNKFNGTIKVLADALEVAPGFVSRVLNGTGAGSRNIGDSLARRIEQVSGCDPNWLDHDHSRIEVSASGPVPLDLDDIELLMQRATPRSRESLRRIATAAAENRLTEADCELLASIAARLAR